MLALIEVVLRLISLRFAVVSDALCFLHENSFNSEMLFIEYTFLHEKHSTFLSLEYSVAAQIAELIGFALSFHLSLSEESYFEDIFDLRKCFR